MGHALDAPACEQAQSAEDDTLRAQCPQVRHSGVLWASGLEVDRLEYPFEISELDVILGRIVGLALAEEGHGARRAGVGAIVFRLLVGELLGEIPAHANGVLPCRGAAIFRAG